MTTTTTFISDIINPLNLDFLVQRLPCKTLVLKIGLTYILMSSGQYTGLLGHVGVVSGWFSILWSSQNKADKILTISVGYIATLCSLQTASFFISAQSTAAIFTSDCHARHTYTDISSQSERLKHATDH